MENLMNLGPACNVALVVDMAFGLKWMVEFLPRKMMRLGLLVVVIPVVMLKMKICRNLQFK